jgi:hypothetical protein
MMAIMPELISAIERVSPSFVPSTDATESGLMGAGTLEHPANASCAEARFAVPMRGPAPSNFNCDPTEQERREWIAEDVRTGQATYYDILPDSEAA